MDTESRQSVEGGTEDKAGATSALTPFSFLKAATDAVPAVKYALGVGGVAAVVSIIAGFNIDYRVAVFGTTIVFALMFVLVLFACYTALASEFFYWPSVVATWAFLLLLIATTFFVMSSYFFEWPKNLDTILGKVNTALQCFTFDPRSGNQDPLRGSRPCVPGMLAYIKWFDPTHYPSPIPQDRPNRIVQVAARDPRGLVEWDEYELVNVIDGDERWHTHGQNWVTVMDSYAACGERGVLLRRIDLNPIPIGSGKTECDLPDHIRSIKEWLFPTNAAERIKRGDHVYICMRDVKQPCSKEVDLGLITDNVPFQKSDFEIVSVRSDP